MARRACRERCRVTASCWVVLPVRTDSLVGDMRGRSGLAGCRQLAGARLPLPVLVLGTVSPPRRCRRLNTLMHKLTAGGSKEGFKVSPTQHSCTRGLWMWSVPIPIKDADGQPCNLVGAAAGETWGSRGWVDGGWACAQMES